jgi:tRNA pseudouridine55 synthase
LDRAAASTDFVINLDKPPGITSHDAVTAVKRALGLRKVGHAGTLDPTASGVLLILCGRATRLMPYLLALGKKYSVTVTLGAATDTLDTEGSITRRLPFSHVTKNAVERALAGFTGDILQTPPMFSAVKIAGTPLYRLARKGIEVERKPRSVKIHALKLVLFDPPLLGLDVTCSSGTYVRTLAADLADALDACGHVSSLTRTAVGPFTVENSVRLDQAAASSEKFIAPDDALAHLDETTLEPALLRMLLNGMTLKSAPDPDVITPRFVRIKDQDGALVCIASGIGGEIKMVTPMSSPDKYLKQSFR